jgi:hypothetical protein
MKLHEGFTQEESDKIYANFLAIVNDSKRRDKLVRKHGVNAENVAYGTAVNQVKKQAITEPSTEEPSVEEPTTEEPMEDVKLKEMVKAALMNPKKADLNKDGELSDYEKTRGAAIEKNIQKEDLDLGHEDNEPHMIKADLYRIGKYAMELYKMVDQFEGEQEVDFPAWWQSKITTAKNMISSAKHYLEFELEEPQIDAMVGVASEEGAIGEGKMTKKEEKIVKGLKKSGFKKDDPEMYAIARAKAKIKEAVLAKLKQK